MSYEAIYSLSPYPLSLPKGISFGHIAMEKGDKQTGKIHLSAGKRLKDENLIGFGERIRKFFAVKNHLIANEDVDVFA
jgi:hypothetical protein